MNIALVDADLLGSKNHRFPNLAIMKLSSHHKNKGDNTELILDYKQLHGGLFVHEFDKTYISKVFTKTEVPQEILRLKNIEIGGTGFFFDKSPKLSYEIEHSMPDYELYNKFVRAKKMS